MFFRFTSDDEGGGVERNLRRSEAEAIKVGWCELSLLAPPRSPFRR